VARNPYSPGVGTRPPYLAGREQEVRLFTRLLEDFPEKRRNLRVTGLRGVGKTVLLKEYQRIAIDRGWVVVRRDFSPRLQTESEFAMAITEYFREALDQLSGAEKMKGLVSNATKAVAEIGLPFGASVKLKDSAPTSVLEDRFSKALKQIGRVAQSQGKGVVFLFDEAHTVHDDKNNNQFPLGALLASFVAAHDDDDEPLSLMLVLCGLPPLIGNIHAARSNAERFFRGVKVENLPLEPKADEQLSEAALALVKPAEEAETLHFEPGLAEQIAQDVDGYPYFIQWFGEALWEAAELQGATVIDHKLYERNHGAIQDALDSEFFEPRYKDARPADQKTLRIAASLGGEFFTTSAVGAADGRSTGAVDQSLRRLVLDNLLYRDDHGVYAYTAPVFGEYLRRSHPRLDED
jgi:hypothetical protein